MRKGQIPDKVRSQWELWISFYMVTTFKSPSRVTTHNVIVFPMTLGARFLQPNTLLPSLKCIRWRSRCAARGTSFIESIKEASEKLLLLSVAVWLALYILLPVVWHVTRLAKEAPQLEATYHGIRHAAVYMDVVETFLFVRTTIVSLQLYI